MCSACTPALPAQRIAEHNNHKQYPLSHTCSHSNKSTLFFFFVIFVCEKLEYFHIFFIFHFVLSETNFYMASRKMAYNHTLQQKYKPHFQLPKNLVLRQHKLLNKSRHYGNERLQDSDVLPNPRTGYILDWKITEPQNMSRNIHDFVDLKKKKIALGNNILYSGSSRKGRYNSTGRVSSQKASRKTDAGLSPWCGRDFSPSQLPVQTLIQCLHSLCVHLHALTSVCGLKLPNTSSHTGHTASTDNTSPTFTLATPQTLTTPVQPSPWPHHKH